MPIYDRYAAGQQLGMQQGQNALRMAQAVQAQQRQQKLRDILAGVVTPAVPGAPAQAETMAGPAIPARAEQPAQFDLQTAIPMMAQAGFGPEALALQQKMLTSQGQLPASPREFEYLKQQFPERKFTYNDYLGMKRKGQTIKMIGNVPHLVNELTGESVPLSSLEKEAGSAAEIERRKAAGRLYGQTQAAASLELPTAELSAEKTKTQINELLDMPGLEDAFGAKSYLPTIRGTDRANFEAQLERFKSTIFIDNRAKLKGGGSITDYEGNQAAQAEVAMDQAQSAEQFRKSMRDYIYWVDRGLAKLRKEAGKQQAPTGTPRKYKIGDIVTAPNGQRVIIKTLTASGEPDEVVPAK